MLGQVYDGVTNIGRRIAEGLGFNMKDEDSQRKVDGVTTGGGMGLVGLLLMMTGVFSGGGLLGLIPVALMGLGVAMAASGFSDGGEKKTQFDKDFDSGGVDAMMQGRNKEILREQLLEIESGAETAANLRMGRTASGKGYDAASSDNVKGAFSHMFYGTEFDPNNSYSGYTTREGGNHDLEKTLQRYLNKHSRTGTARNLDDYIRDSDVAREFVRDTEASLQQKAKELTENGAKDFDGTPLFEGKEIKNLTMDTRLTVDQTMQLMREMHPELDEEALDALEKELKKRGERSADDSWIGRTDRLTSLSDATVILFDQHAEQGKALGGREQLYTVEDYREMLGDTVVDAAVTQNGGREADALSDLHRISEIRYAASSMRERDMTDDGKLNGSFDTGLSKRDRKGLIEDMYAYDTIFRASKYTVDDLLERQAEARSLIDQMDDPSLSDEQRREVTARAIALTGVGLGGMAEDVYEVKIEAEELRTGMVSAQEKIDKAQTGMGLDADSRDGLDSFTLKDGTVINSQDITAMVAGRPTTQAEIDAAEAGVNVNLNAEGVEAFQAAEWDKLIVLNDDETINVEATRANLATVELNDDQRSQLMTLRETQVVGDISTNITAIEGLMTDEVFEFGRIDGADRTAHREEIDARLDAIQEDLKYISKLNTRGNCDEFGGDQGANAQYLEAMNRIQQNMQALEDEVVRLKDGSEVELRQVLAAVGQDVVGGDEYALQAALNEIDGKSDVALGLHRIARTNNAPASENGDAGEITLDALDVSEVSEAPSAASAARVAKTEEPDSSKKR